MNLYAYNLTKICVFSSLFYGMSTSVTVSSPPHGNLTSTPNMKYIGVVEVILSLILN